MPDPRLPQGRAGRWQHGGLACVQWVWEELSHSGGSVRRAGELEEGTSSSIKGLSEGFLYVSLVFQGVGVEDPHSGLAMSS